MYAFAYARNKPFFESQSQETHTSEKLWHNSTFHQNKHWHRTVKVKSSNELSFSDQNFTYKSLSEVPWPNGQHSSLAPNESTVRILSRVRVEILPTLTFLMCGCLSVINHYCNEPWTLKLPSAHAINWAATSTNTKFYLFSKNKSHIKSKRVK